MIRTLTLSSSFQLTSPNYRLSNQTIVTSTPGLRILCSLTSMKPKYPDSSRVTTFTDEVTSCRLHPEYNGLAVIKMEYKQTAKYQR
jgi:hypothetical protein